MIQAGKAAADDDLQVRKPAICWYRNAVPGHEDLIVPAGSGWIAGLWLTQAVFLKAGHFDVMLTAS